jgi:exonuclease SbcD
LAGLALFAKEAACMRILHTSDWHLGRLFHGVHLTDEQAHVLDQLVALVADAKPDVLIVAGDVYDRSVPPVEAVELLDDTLTRIAVDLATPVVMIAGNHDSPERIGFGSRLLARSAVHLAGDVAADLTPVRLGDEHGPIEVFPIPYAEPAVVRARLQDDGVRDHQGAMGALIARARATRTPGSRAVLVAHAFVTGGSESESERPLSVGGAATVAAASFEGFNYVALGHLHRPQHAGSERVVYSGSLLKYSFAEASHRKSVSLVEIDAAGAVRTEAVELTPRRDVRTITGSLAEVLAGPASGDSRDDYVSIALTDRGAILDAIGRIREVYPYCLHVDRSAFLKAGSEALAGTRADHRRRTVDELFDDFVRAMTGESMTEEERAAFAEIVDGMERVERESDGDEIVAAPAGGRS